MDYTSYIYTAIALLPFILWATILFALSTAQDNQLKLADSESIGDNDSDYTYTDNVVIIPYGLIFPIYYRSPTGAQDFG